MWKMKQVNNARIMDQGTPRNIMTELHMTANQYSLVTTMYYVTSISRFPFTPFPLAYLNSAFAFFHLINSTMILTNTVVKIPYVLAKSPSNLLVKRLRPSVWQARILARAPLHISSPNPIPTNTSHPDILGYNPRSLRRRDEPTGLIRGALLPGPLRGRAMAGCTAADVLLVPAGRDGAEDRAGDHTGELQLCGQRGAGVRV